MTVASIIPREDQISSGPPSWEQDTFYKTDSIASGIVDGLAVILDLASGRYVILDRAATAMWRCLLRTPAAARLEELMTRFDVPEERLRHDLISFTELCQRRGYLVNHPMAPTPALLPAVVHHPFRPTTFRAWLAIAVTARALRTKGFAATYQACAASGKFAPADDNVQALLREAEHAFARAENFYVMRAAPKDCLPRSLALYRFMISVGIPVEHYIGVYRFPFAAHAWVEFRGQVLRDSPDFTKHYAKLAIL